MEFTFIQDAHPLILTLFQDLQFHFLLIFHDIFINLKILKIHKFHPFILMYLCFIIPALFDFINSLKFVKSATHFYHHFLNLQQNFKN